MQSLLRERVAGVATSDESGAKVVDAWRSDFEWIVLGQMRRSNVPANLPPRSRTEDIPADESDFAFGRQAGWKGSGAPDMPEGGVLESRWSGTRMAGRVEPTRGTRAAAAKGAGKATARSQEWAARTAVSKGKQDKSCGGGSSPQGRKQPAPNKKQPLGKKEVGAPTLKWLGRATERCALEYVDLLTQLETAEAGVRDVKGERPVFDAVAPRFGVSSVIQQVDELLHQLCARPPRTG